MKNLKTILPMICLAALAACNHSGKDSTAKADSANNSLDSGQKVTPNSNREISGDDAKFAVEAANGGMAEVELGTLAQQKATNPDVKNFGAMMVTDHSKANAEMKQLAASKNITLPDSINNDEKKIKMDLMGKSGADFDKAYVKAMVDDHKEDIKAFEEAAKKVKYPEMQAFITKTLPVLKMHLASIEKIQNSMK
jgi:putative membrane protein